MIGFRLTVTPVTPGGGGGNSTVPGSTVSAADPFETTTRVKEVVVHPPITSVIDVDQLIHADVMTMLRPDVEYHVTLSALNPFGAGPPATINVRTEPRKTSKKDR